MSTARYTRPTAYFFHPSVERVVRRAELPMRRGFFFGARTPLGVLLCAIASLPRLTLTPWESLAPSTLV
jgi:hypothetical protein